MLRQQRGAQKRMGVALMDTLDVHVERKRSWRKRVGPLQFAHGAQMSKALLKALPLPRPTHWPQMKKEKQLWTLGGMFQWSKAADKVSIKKRQIINQS